MISNILNFNLKLRIEIALTVDVTLYLITYDVIWSLIDKKEIKIANLLKCYLSIYHLNQSTSQFTSISLRNSIPYILNSRIQ